MDESSLTGESDSLRKEPYEKCIQMKNENTFSKVPSPLMLSGTNCVEGTGYGIVLAVGDHSQKDTQKTIVLYLIRILIKE